jgi:hypothetical protein
MDEVIIDGVSYIKIWENPNEKYYGDPSAFLRNYFTEEKLLEFRRKAMSDLVKAGSYARKDVWEKQHPKTYRQGDLFSEL